MVDALERNAEKLKEIYEELQKARDPIQRESIQQRLDNLLDIRISLSKEKIHGN